MTRDARDRSEKLERVREGGRSLEGERLRARIEKAKLEQRRVDVEKRREASRAVELQKHEINDRQWSNHRIRRDGREVGVVSVSYDESGKRAELVDLRIHDRRERGRGTGAEVARRVEWEASARGMKEIRADLSDGGMAPEDRGSPEARRRLIRFYEKQGWEVQRIEDPKSPIYARAKKGLADRREA